MKVPDIPPPFCSSCHCQDADKKYVDFEAYWDGPVIEGETFKQSIDDLVMCEDCLGAAATLIGFVNNKQMRTENYELGKAVEEKDTYIEALEAVIRDLEHTLGQALLGKVKRGQGRPVVRVPDNIEQLVKEKVV